MTETLEIRGPAQTEPSEPTARPIGSLFFADLVRAHYASERALAEPGNADVEWLEVDYAEKLAQFREEEGRIAEAYCVREASAVALTTRRQTTWQWLRGEHDIRLHRVSNWLMPSAVLHDCDDLAILAGEILRGTPKRIALRWAHEIESQMLAFVERTRSRPTDAEIDDFVADATARVAAARECYEDRAGCCGGDRAHARRTGRRAVAAEGPRNRRCCTSRWDGRARGRGTRAAWWRRHRCGDGPCASGRSSRRNRDARARRLDLVRRAHLDSTLAMVGVESRGG